MAAKFGLDHKLLGTFLMFLVFQPFAAPSRTLKLASVQPSSNGTGGRHGTIHVVENYQFYDGTPRWEKFPVTYGFLSRSRLPPGLNSNAVNNTVAAAFKVWEAAVPKFAFKKVEPGNIANIKIVFTRIDNETVYGLGSRPPNGTLQLDNSNRNWSTGPTPAQDQLDLQSGVMHEIGHTLGLLHSTDPSAVMNGKLISGTTKRVLAQDDKDGIQKLYA